MAKRLLEQLANRSAKKSEGAMLQLTIRRADAAGSEKDLATY
jgi:hypothetical protein